MEKHMNFKKMCIALLMSMACIGAFAQMHSVKGRVVDVMGEPIIGANVVVLGTGNGVITDLDGLFNLQNVASDAKLQVSFIGYILNERARELAGEYLRWPDLVRTGKLAEYVEAHNPDIPAGRITSKFYLRPIPLSAIELNPALAGHQNEGW